MRLIILAVVLVGGAVADAAVLREEGFEGALEGWHGIENAVAVTSDQAHAGEKSLQFDLSGGQSGAVFIGVGLPAAEEPRARLVRVSLWSRADGAEGGSASVQLLKIFPEGREPEWFDYLNPQFMSTPITPEWTRSEAVGLVDPEIAALQLYIMAGGSRDDGQIRLDDLKVELLERGVLFDRRRKDTIITADRVTIDVIVTSPDELESGSVRILDEQDRPVRTVELKPGLAHQPIELPTRGYYQLNAQVQYTDGIACSASTPIAVVGPLIPDAQRLASPFGLTGGGELFVAAGANWDRPFINLNNDVYKKAADEGFPSTRPTPIVAEPAPGKSSIYCLWPQPPWLQDKPSGDADYYASMYPMKDYAVFQDLVRYVVKQNPHQMEYVEVANEPDFWKGPLEGLVRYHREMAEAVKSVSPETKVIGPCPCTIKIEFLDMLHKLGIFDFLDGLVVHAYVRATAPEGEFIELVRKLKAYMASIGKGEMPIYITEYGWTVPPGDWQQPVDPLTQARYVSRSLILLVAEEIDSIIYFNLRWADPRGPAGYGLLNWESTPRPGYAAYANTARCLTGVEGPGRVLQVTPTAYLALFKKGGGTVAAAWDVAAEARLFLPGLPSYIRDMTGRPVRVNENYEVPIGPSPIFAEIPDLNLREMQVWEPVEAQQGSTLQLRWEPFWCPSPLQAGGRVVQIPPGTPCGEYLLIGEDESGWMGQKVVVTAPLEIGQVELTWPLDQPTPQLQGVVRSYAGSDDQPLPYRAIVDLEALPNGQAGLDLIARGRGEQTFGLPLSAIRFGRRYRGTLMLNVPTMPRFEPKQALDLTCVPCRPLTGAISELEAMDISEWGPFTGSAMEPRAVAPEDCSATLRAGYDAAGLRFLIEVRDNFHQQKMIPVEMWQEDSVQIALDLDADQPWRPNEGGFDGHKRIFEYGVALGPDGPMTWRWISHAEGLPGGAAEPRVQARITREGDRTVYDLTLPWPVLAMDGPPAAGSKIGLALVVNDVDQTPDDRSGLALFGGIVDRKDPTAFGTMWVR
ncbi:MAG: hypothetical protein GXY33_02080 [Phycisphaerae bacterium]|nr:hypothetical protein [Phycisphaerae bacterium]